MPDVAASLPATTCPLCGGPNACAPAACGRFDVKCWCTDAKIDPAALARVPGPLRGPGVPVRAVRRGRRAPATVTSRPRVDGRGRRRTGYAVRTTLICSVPLSGSHTSPGRPRIWRTFAPSRAKGMDSNRSRRRIEAQQRVRAPVGRPHLVALVDVDRVDARSRAGGPPLPPGRGPARARIVHRELPGEPLGHPDAPVAVAPHAACALVARRAARPRSIRRSCDRCAR